MPGGPAFGRRSGRRSSGGGTVILISRVNGRRAAEGTGPGYTRPPWSAAHRPRRRRRPGDPPPLPGQPRARRAPRARGGDARRRGRDRHGRAAVDVVLLDVHVGSGDGVAFLARAATRLLPDVRVAMLTGTADTAANPTRAGADASSRSRSTLDAARRHVERLAAGVPPGRLTRSPSRRRSAAPPSSRSASSATSSSARRRAARSASARRRSPSRPRSSRATPTSSAATQLEALREAEDAAADGDERERLYRLRKTCEGGLITAELAERDDELENAILAARVTLQGEELPLRSAQAKLAVLDDVRRPRGARRRCRPSAPPSSTPTGSTCSRAGEELEAELSGEPDPVARNEEEKGISLRELERALAAASDAARRGAGRALRERWFERLLGPGARRRCRRRPTSPTCAGSRRSSRRYTKERAVEVCLDDARRGSASTSPASRTSGSTSTTGRRSRRAPA